MKNRVILLSLVTWLCQISVWAQLEVDSLGSTIIHKELKLSGEEGSLRQSLFGKEGDFYWSDGFGGLKMYWAQNEMYMGGDRKKEKRFVGQRVVYDDGIKAYKTKCLRGFN